jgi:hypothetical protein
MGFFGEVAFVAISASPGRFSGYASVTISNAIPQSSDRPYDREMASATAAI